MMSATIAHENYVAATATNTATIMTSITDRITTMLAKIEQLINQYSHEGRKELVLRFPVKTDMIYRTGIDNTAFYHCEWWNAQNAYGIHVFRKIREGYTTVELNENDQRDLILNVLRNAGYEVRQSQTNNWEVKWA